jgi:hypothetical protein
MRRISAPTFILTQIPATRDRRPQHRPSSLQTITFLRVSNQDALYKRPAALQSSNPSRPNPRYQTNNCLVHKANLPPLSSSQLPITIPIQPSNSPTTTMHLPTLLLSLLASTTAAQSTNTTIRYMPFGDSITEIICWRAKLWHRLQSTPFASVNFVGSGRTENNCKDSTYDRDNEGHSGFLAVDIANKGQLDGWLRTNPADVVTMHLGTNDIVQQNKATGDIIAAFTKLVASMRNSNSRMKIIVRP